MKPLLFLAALLSAPVYAADEKPAAVAEETTKPAAHSFAAEEIGWKTTVPAGWDELSRKEVDRLNNKGKEALEKTVGEVDSSGMKQLLNLKKDQVNVFMSTIQTYDEKTDGSWAEHETAIADAIKGAYAEAKLTLKNVKAGKVTIDGKEFSTLSLDIMDAKGEAVLMSQSMYGCLINGKDFSMAITTNNAANKAELEKMVMGSKFKH